MMLSVLTPDGEELAICRCWKCDVRFAMTRRFADNRKMDGGEFYCPNGHPSVFQNSELDRLRREAKDARLREAEVQSELAELKRKRRKRPALRIATTANEGGA